MSKIIKQSIVILIVLLLVSVAVAVLTYIQKSGLEKQNTDLQGQLTESQNKEQDLSQRVSKVTKEAEELRKKCDESNKKAEDVSRKLDDITKKYDDVREKNSRMTEDLAKANRERSDYEDRMQKIRRERDDLIDKLKSRPSEEKIVEKEKIVYKDRIVDMSGNPVDPNALASMQSGADQRAAALSAPVQPANVVIENNANEEYWAGVMRQKAALELELASVKKSLTEKDLKVEELKKVNSDLAIELGRLKNEREEIIRKIKYGDDLADSLSIELARARNDSKAVGDRAERVSAENQNLRSEIKQLSETKVALEKSIARLTDDKATVEKKLIETENIIQGRIDEIWKIKKDVDSRFEANKNNSGEVELAPIVVNAPAAPVKQAPANAQRLTGSVVSVNEENNFIVVDMGESNSVHIGDVFKVYRGKDHIATVSVIQVRKDISAADIKQKTSPIKVGDQVR